MKFLIFCRLDGSSGCGDHAVVYMILDKQDHTQFRDWNPDIGDYIHIAGKWTIIRVKDWK